MRGIYPRGSLRAIRGEFPSRNPVKTVLDKNVEVPDTYPSGCKRACEINENEKSHEIKRLTAE